MPSKQAETQRRYVKRQAKLNRKPRKLFLADEEFLTVKEFVLKLRGES